MTDSGGHITRRSNSNDDEDSDFDLSDMEDDFDLGGFREKRLEELKQECVCHSQRYHAIFGVDAEALGRRMMRSAAMRESLHGRLTEIKEEKDLMTNTA